ncbi:hypothetical protein [Capnocytophaga canis]|uniref:hypothetical protein n=1 Tax=Capnocytophaga canis TaxID=1848903 RepID=UPI0015629B01|nr:hypothetical protein [Capnocytophaga canis]
MKKFYFILALLGVFACSEDENMTADYFKAQQRDNRFFGKWIFIDSNTLEELSDFTRNYIEDGELQYFYLTGEPYYSQKKYYYTKGDRLYVLNPGSGFKVSASVKEFRYEFSNSDNILVLQGYTNGELSSYKESFKRK